MKSEQTTHRKFTGDTAVVEQVLEFIKGIAEVKSYALIGSYNHRLEAAIEENVNANTDMELKLFKPKVNLNVLLSGFQKKRSKSSPARCWERAASTAIWSEAK